MLLLHKLSVLLYLPCAISRKGGWSIHQKPLYNYKLSTSMVSIPSKQSYSLTVKYLLGNELSSYVSQIDRTELPSGTANRKILTSSIFGAPRRLRAFNWRMIKLRAPPRRDLAVTVQRQFVIVGPPNDYLRQLDWDAATGWEEEIPLNGSCCNKHCGKLQDRTM